MIIWSLIWWFWFDYIMDTIWDHYDSSIWLMGYSWNDEMIMIPLYVYIYIYKLWYIIILYNYIYIYNDIWECTIDNNIYIIINIYIYTYYYMYIFIYNGHGLIMIWYINYNMMGGAYFCFIHLWHLSEASRTVPPKRSCLRICLSCLLVSWPQFT